jgi:FAD/FMN-containing dehydrogenase
LHSFPYLTLDKDVRQLHPSDVAAFAAQISGGTLSPADVAYDDARKVWNATVDRRPALIARCLVTSDVQAAVRFAAAHRMLASVRGGGHHIAGNAVAEGGLMIDLSGMRTVRINAKTRTARVGPGALLADLDRESQAHGLATPLGINSTTGVAGLTLGGGFGWLTRRYGLTVDNLLSATVVTADGAVREVSATAEPDLFWALRGGGGNFGVVTSFEFQLHPVGPEVYAGFQQAFDPLLAPGGRNYWKSNNFSTLSDAALDLMIASAAQLPGGECEIFVAQLGGAMARVEPTATPFVGRDARYIMNVHGRWSDAREDERVRTWARQVFQEAAPHATGGGYVNFLTDDEAERVAASYGVNHPRLQAVKQRYDPDNLFRMNLNIAPLAA